jgi:hypothetical protein
MTAQQLQRTESMVASLPIPSRSIKVFGSINCNIHITCESRKTAEKWVLTLGKFCRTVNCVESIDQAVENKNTMLRPTSIKVFRICGVV